MSGITCTVCGMNVSMQQYTTSTIDSKIDVRGISDMEKQGEWLVIPIVVCPKCAKDSIKRRIADALKATP